MRPPSSDGGRFYCASVRGLCLIGGGLPGIAPKSLGLIHEGVSLSQ